MSGKARSSSESSSSDSEALSIKDDEGNFCVQNRIIRSDKNVEVEAKVKVRTRVQLVDVNLKVDCICIDTTNPTKPKKRSY